MLRWDEATGAVGPFRQPAGYTNGHTRRPPGPAGELRARQPARHAHGARRLDHRAGRPLRGRAAEQPERRRGEVATARSGSPTPATASTRTTRATAPSARSPGCYVYRLDPDTGELRVVVDDGVRAQRPRLLARRAAAVRRPTPAVATGRTGPPNMRVFDVADDGTLDGGARVRRRRRPARSTASASTRTAGSGRAPATACTATTPTARCSARCWCRRPWPTSASAAPSATACSSPPRRRCTRCYVRVRGARTF